MDSNHIVLGSTLFLLLSNAFSYCHLTFLASAYLASVKEHSLRWKTP